MLELTDFILDDISGGWGTTFAKKWKVVINNSNSSKISVIGNYIF